MAGPNDLKRAQSFLVNRYEVDLSTLEVLHEVVACADLEDALGGIARVPSCWPEWR
jgi:hypothetical protein